MDAVVQDVKRGPGRPRKDVPVATPEKPTVMQEPSAKIERYRMQTDPAFDNWLLNRLERDKPYWSRAGWLAQLRQMAASNEWHMMRLGDTILLASILKDPADPRVKVKDFICWSMSENEKVVTSECLKLFRELRQWSHTMNAVAVSFGNSSDVNPGDMKHALNGEYASDLFWDMTK